MASEGEKRHGLTPLTHGPSLPDESQEWRSGPNTDYISRLSNLVAGTDARVRGHTLPLVV